MKIALQGHWLMEALRADDSFGLHVANQEQGLLYERPGMPLMKAASWRSLAGFGWETVSGAKRH